MSALVVTIFFTNAVTFSTRKTCDEFKITGGSYSLGGRCHNHSVLLPGRLTLPSSVVRVGRIAPHPEPTLGGSKVFGEAEITGEAPDANRQGGRKSVERGRKKKRGGNR